jgi:Zn-dependent protease
MAAAGPLANLVLATLAFAGLKAGLAAGWFGPPESLAYDRLVAGAAGAEGIGRALSVLLVLNLLLAVFNAIPLPPMDGASVLAGFVPPLRELKDRLRGSPFSLAGLLLAWVLFPYLFHPVLRFTLALLYA